MSWGWNDCAAAYACRRKKSTEKTIKRNVRLRLEEDGNRTSFIFKMYGTDIVELRLDEQGHTSYIIRADRYLSSATTIRNIAEYSGIRLFGHQSKAVMPVISARSNWGTTRKFKVPLLNKIVEAQGYPFVEGTEYVNGVPVNPPEEEQFWVHDPKPELERKRRLRPWLDALKVACALTEPLSENDQGARVPYGVWTDAVNEVSTAIASGAPPDAGQLMNLVHTTMAHLIGFRSWRRRVAMERSALVKGAYTNISKEWTEKMRSKRIMTPGYRT